MSFFAFPKDENGEIRVSDKDLLDAIELLINQVILLNMRFEEAFQTKIDEDDT